jgi:hypothetical protein
LKAFCSHQDGRLLTISRPDRDAFQSLCRGYAQYGVDQDDMRYNQSFQADFSAQFVSLDAMSAIISSEAFHVSTAGGQHKFIIPALVRILAQSSLPLDHLHQKYILSGKLT